MSTDGRPRESIHRGGTAALVLILAFVAGCSTEPTQPPPGFEEQPGNQAPVANAGSDRSVSARIPVALNGSASTDPDNDDLTFAWSIEGPEGSSAAPEDPAAETTTFLPDLPGEYRVTLIVDDGTETNATTVTVTAEDNTIRQMIGAEGGRVETSDGSTAVEIPAGAFDEPTEVRLTPARQVQLEAAIQSVDGTRAEWLDRADAAWSVEVGGPLPSAWDNMVYDFVNTFPDEGSGSEGRPVWFRPDGPSETDAWRAERTAQGTRYVGEVTGPRTIIRFSGGPDDAIRLDTPASADVEAPFDGTVRVTSGDGDLITSVVLRDASILPVETRGMFVGAVPLADGEGSIANRYACVGRGRGVVAVETTASILGVNGEPFELPTVQLAADVECVAPEEPLSAAFTLEVNRVHGGVADPHAPRVHLAGEFFSRVLDWDNRTVTNTGVDFGSRVEFGAGMSDGATMYVTQLGRWSLYDADGGALSPDVPINATQLQDLDHIGGDRWIATTGGGDIFGVEYSPIDESLTYEGFDVLFGAGDTENVVAVEVLDEGRALGIQDDPVSETRKLVVIDGIEDLSSWILGDLSGSPSVARSELRFLGAGLACTPGFGEDTQVCVMFSRGGFGTPDTAPFFVFEVNLMTNAVRILHEGEGAYAGFVPEPTAEGIRWLGVSEYSDRIDRFDVREDGTVSTSSIAPDWPPSQDGYEVGSFLEPTVTATGIYWGFTGNKRNSDESLILAYQFPF